MKFFLGTHHPHWLKRIDVPLFISRRRLVEFKKLPVALGPWALDSGGFSELTIHGKWTITPQQFVEEVHRFAGEVGNLEFVACQDWMCEPQIREGGTGPGGTQIKGTGLSVKEHQRRTVRNVLDLMELDPDIPWMPVLQGWEIHEYYEHLDMYDEAKIDLTSFHALGIGSVCRRGHTDEVEKMMIDLHRAGLKLHGFGFKVKGLRKVGDRLASADSMAWSYQARRREPLPECVERAEQGLERGHKNCANCMRYAMKWRTRVLESMNGNGGIQPVAKKKKNLPAKTEPIEPEIVGREEEVLLRADELVHSIGENYYELGQTLYEIEAGEYYTRKGYASFQEFCEIQLGFARTKAKNCIRMWEVLDQRLGIPWETESKSVLQLRGIPWTNIRVVMPIIAPRGKPVLGKREAKKWLLEAKKRPRTELQELVRQQKGKDKGNEPDSPERTARGNEVVDAEPEAALAVAAATETPFVEDIPQEIDDAEVCVDDPGTLGLEEVDHEDVDTGEFVRMMRITFMLTREEYAHVLAAMQRMAQITGISHPGKVLDLMAAEINETLADTEAGGAAHRLDWYVKQLERIFDVEIEVEVPPRSKLRTMSRVEIPEPTST